MSKKNSAVAQPMLIFIPDITGFSKFVNDTDIAHSQHIIEELLEIIINANEINLEVSEIEGDAVLFYKTGELMSMKQLFTQVESMYSKFHTHLKMYEHTRICQCGACSAANNLKLKFVINYGDVSFNKIKNHTKLFGKDVIVAHRLMKNKVEHAEYVLFSETLIKAQKDLTLLEISNWQHLEPGSTEYDIGILEYQYASLTPLSKKVPIPKIESYGLKGKKTKVMDSDHVIDAPLEMVFNVLSDLSIRHLWSAGIKDSDHLNGKIAHNGSTHRCLINDNKNDPFFVAHDFQTSLDRVVFTETDSNVGVSEVFELLRTGPNSTRLQTHLFLKGNFIKPILFQLFFKKRLTKGKKEMNDNINKYCQDLIRNGNSPDSQVVLNKQG